jgi:hypothetical protein
VKKVCSFAAIVCALKKIELGNNGILIVTLLKMIRIDFLITSVREGEKERRAQLIFIPLLHHHLSSHENIVEEGGGASLSLCNYNIHSIFI